MEKVAIVIPARYASTRFPGKPLIQIGGISMIERVYRQCEKATGIAEIWVATDNQAIHDAVSKFGNVMMTSPEHKSGTDRLVEASQRIDADIFINVQGDEPFIPPEMIHEVSAAVMSAEKSIYVGTLCSSFNTADEIRDQNIVKVVTDVNDFALYFSRSVIPCPRDGRLEEAVNLYYRHIGIYAYRKEFLLKFPRLQNSPLENIEKLEQLRVLQAGYAIKTPATSHHSPGVDVPEDIEKLRELF